MAHQEGEEYDKKSPARYGARRKCLCQAYITAGGAGGRIGVL